VGLKDGLAVSLVRIAEDGSSGNALRILRWQTLGPYKLLMDPTQSGPQLGMPLVINVPPNSRLSRVKQNEWVNHLDMSIAAELVVIFAVSWRKRGRTPKVRAWRRNPDDHMSVARGETSSVHKL
jgi:hypothetical protein